MNDLLDRRVALTITDPWDFVTENGSRFLGRIAELRGDTELLIELDQPLATTRFWLANVRHLGVELIALNVGAEISVNLRSMARDSANQIGKRPHPVYLVIGSVTLYKHKS